MMKPRVVIIETAMEWGNKVQEILEFNSVAQATVYMNRFNTAWSKTSMVQFNALVVLSELSDQVLTDRINQGEFEA